MPTLLHPGVYVREIPGGSRSIEGVPTSTAIFVGETERGPLTVTRINGRTQYTTSFGGYRRRRSGEADPFSERLLLPYSLDGFFSNGGTTAYILRMCDGFNVADPNTTVVASRTEPGGGVADFVTASSPGAWGNLVGVTAALSTDGDATHMRLAVFYTPPGSTTATFVEEFDRLSFDPNEENYVADVLRRSAYIRWNPDAPNAVPAALDNSDSAPFPTATALVASAVVLGGGIGGDGDFDAADLPVFLTDRLLEVDDASLMVAASARQLPEAPTTDAEFVEFENHFVTYVNNRPQLDLFFVGELPSLEAEPDPVSAAINWSAGTGGNTPPVASTTFNAVYWPHLDVPDPAGVGKNPALRIPPGGYVAGLYSQVDGRRGVFKAPAGTEVLLGGVRALSFDVLDVHQDSLNPRAINALRRIPNAGLVVWGARTRQPSTEWRYIPVRRTAIFLRRSIYNGIQWAVFEPNDQRLWQSLRNTIGAFMEVQFRNGMFAGATSPEAYFVKVDAETTTPDDQAAGIVNILVGFAPLRPAEFVVVSLQQMAGRSS
jgi:phage tail sheath protein FI